MTHRILRICIPVLLACLAISLFCVVYPMYVIRPFRAQGARELEAALVVARYRPVITVISACGALLALAGYWQLRPQGWRRVLASAGAVFVAVLAVLARVNVYEVMFHPIERSSFTAASQVKLDKLDKDEKVIAVVVGGEARAYPVRSLAYHHLTNDILGRVAIVATY